MTFSPITAISPLDGRYASKLDALRPLTSELGYMHRRVQVEIAWFIALSDAGFAQFKPLSAGARTYLLGLVKNFSQADGEAIKAIEKTTNHDVKAVEYWLKSKFEARPELLAASEFVHFACTSEDINNTSHALQLRAVRGTVLLPQLDRLILMLRDMAHAYAEVPMLSRTHGQTASPTTVGKEIANVVVRLQAACGKIANVHILGKMNGAVGNYNAHLSAWPDFDWEAFAKREVGSSTMPHKVNPIDFENAEGNLGLSNALLRHLSEKLPISRWQRDLTDSTVLRNIGVALGYAVLAYQSMMAGLGKLEINTAAIAADLDEAWEVLAEPIQTVMRRYGLPQPYEQLKAFTRGQAMTQALMQGFIEGLAIPPEEKARLLAMSPASYTGKAAELARRV